MWTEQIIQAMGIIDARGNTSETSTPCIISGGTVFNSFRRLVVICINNASNPVGPIYFRTDTDAAGGSPTALPVSTVTWTPSDAGDVLIMELNDSQVPDKTKYVDAYCESGSPTLSTIMLAEECAQKPASLNDAATVTRFPVPA